MDFCSRGRAALAAMAVVGLCNGVSAAEAGRGKAAFEEACAGCHEVGPGAENAVGPALNGVVGQSAAGSSGYTYSDALHQAAADGLVWDEESLGAFLADPRGFLKGNRMAFPGVENEETRRNIIAYLATLEAKE